MLIFYKMKPLLLLSLLLTLLGCKQLPSTSSVSLATPIIERQSERAASAQLSQPVLPARPFAVGVLIAMFFLTRRLRRLRRQIRQGGMPVCMRKGPW